jgi:hypothetical protein
MGWIRLLPRQSWVGAALLLAFAVPVDAEDLPDFVMEPPVERLLEDDGAPSSGVMPSFELDDGGDSLRLENPAQTEEWRLLRWAEYRYGQRLRDSDLNAQSQLNELRVQFGHHVNHQTASLDARADLLLDEVLQEATIDWREFKIRPTNTPDYLSVTVGRQIINWILRDILPLNDFFPKDFNAYFMGRDAEGEYMKSPSDAIQAHLSSAYGQFDLVYAPRFVSNRYPEGERLSYFSPFSQSVAGEADPLPHQVADKWFSDDVWYARYSKRLGADEFYLFFHDGYWVAPNALDPVTATAYHARLRSYGAAWRSPGLGGLLTLETSWYDSLDDPDGDDPLIPNDQLRGLVRYDRELAKNLNMTAQYYIEHRLRQDAYEDALPAGSRPSEEDYHQLTLRLTKSLMQQTVIFSFFGFYSPTEDDFYLRANVRYQPDDHWKYHAGINFFDGKEDNTRWGQYHDNSNLYAGIRYIW